MDNVNRTIVYVLNLFEQSEYYKTHQEEKQYRLDHTFRVASIGKEIALEEELDVDAVVVGCLIHDISYVNDFTTPEEHKGHGRKSAEIAKDFVESLEMDESLKEQLLYGVAVHVDDKADYEMERTVLIETIGECDNIDRFDAYRLYEGLLYSKLSEKTLDDQIDFCETKINRLNELKKFKFKSVTSNSLWNEKLDYQIEYYKRLHKQLLRSNRDLLTE